MKNLLLTLGTFLCLPAHAESAHTPQMKQLTSYVKNIQVAEFQKRYATADITSEELAELKNTAAQIQEQLHQELHALNQNNQTMSVSSMAKGAGQLYLAALGAMGAVFTANNYIKTLGQSAVINLSKTPRDILQTIEDNFFAFAQTTKIFTPCALVPVWGVIFSQFCDIKTNKLAFTALCLIPVALAAYLTYLCIPASIKNLKNGFNYKKYLETRLSNINTIIALLDKTVEMEN